MYKELQIADLERQVIEKLKEIEGLKDALNGVPAMKGKYRDAVKKLTHLESDNVALKKNNERLQALLCSGCSGKGWILGGSAGNPEQDPCPKCDGCGSEAEANCVALKKEIERLSGIEVMVLNLSHPNIVLLRRDVADLQRQLKKAMQTIHRCTCQNEGG